MTRVGAVRYLNALPLTAALERESALRSLRYAAPSQIAGWLRAGEIDLGLVPMVEAAADPEYRVIPGHCIAARGAVESVLLFHERAFDFARARRIGVDRSSRSSVELLRVLLQLDGNSGCEFVEVAPELRPLDDFDALLLIGDAALAAAAGGAMHTDLALEWFRRTQLPFVFALWVGRSGVSAEARAAVRRAAVAGLASRKALAEEFCRASPGMLTAERAHRYLTEVIRYELGEAEMESIARFHALRGVRARPRFYE